VVYEVVIDEKTGKKYKKYELYSGKLSYLFCSTAYTKSKYYFPVDDVSDTKIINVVGVEFEVIQLLSDLRSYLVAEIRMVFSKLHQSQHYFRIKLCEH